MESPTRRVVVVGLSPEALAAWVTASCQAQGVPVKVTDPGTVDQVRVLLGGTPTEIPAQARSARRGSVGERLQTPARIDSGRVDGAGSTCPGLDDSVIEDRTDNRSLPGEVQVRPLTA